jgi:hypothetical protein
MFRNSVIALIILVFALFGCKSNKQTASAASDKPKRTRKLLTDVTLTSMELSAFPKYAHDGEKWDAYAPGATDPDVFVLIKWNENVLYQSEVRENSPYGTPVPFAQNLPIALKPFDQPLLIEVFDEDGVSSNDNMAYFTVNVKDFEGKETIELVKGELVLKLGAQWSYR